jgi:stage II sporulation protein Q
MEGRRVKKSVIYGLYAVAILLIIASIYLMELSGTTSFQTEEEPLTYVSRTIFDQTLSVVSQTNTQSKVIVPFVDENVKLTKSFYNENDDEESQQNAIIYYENTYMQSTGLFYTSDTVFDVIAILDGTVEEVTEDDLLGNIVKIKHDNGIVSIYESLDNVNVKENDIVKRGDIIATSGKSNLFKDSDNGLYFEVLNDGVNLNPLLCYEKTISEIKG